MPVNAIQQRVNAGWAWIYLSLSYPHLPLPLILKAFIHTSLPLLGQLVVSRFAAGAY